MGDHNKPGTPGSRKPGTPASSKPNTPASRMSTRNNPGNKSTAIDSPKQLNPTNEMEKILSAMNSLTEKVETLDKKVDGIGHNLSDKVDKLNNDVSEVQKSIEFALGQSQDACNKIDALQKTVDKQATVIEKLKRQTMEADTKCEALHEKMLQSETYTRRENLLFHGVNQENKEDCSAKVRKILKETLEMNPTTVDGMCFQRCHRLPGAKKPTPIICRFAQFSERQSVWSQKEKLKKKGKGIRMTEHFPAEVVQRRNQLAPIMMAAIDAKKKATLKDDKLLIDGETYTVKSLNTLPPNLDPAHVATKRVGDVTCFFTEASPLSNFYRVKFDLEGKTYSCVEEALQLCKAEFAQKQDVMRAIRQASHPREMKKLGDSCKVDMEKWLPVAQDVVTRACRAKFRQDQRCQDFLIRTVDTTLAEAGPDKVWGIGHKMSNPDAFVMDNWTGQNILGNILMKVRQEIEDQSD